jgi:hypothetical protein
MMITIQRSTFTLALAGSMLLLTSCGEVRTGSESPSGTEANEPPVAVSESTIPPTSTKPDDQSIKPLSLEEVVGFSDQDLALVLSAEAKSWNRCVTDLEDTSLLVESPSVDEISAKRDLQRSREEFADSELIGRYGYAEWPELAVSNRPLSDKMPSEALQQKAHEKCDSLVLDELGVTDIGGVGSVPAFIVDAQVEIRLALAEFLKTATEDWSTCMEVRGYPGAGLLKPYTSWAPPGSSEIEAALADSECRTSVGYTAAKFAYLEDQTEKWVKSNPDLVTKALSLRDAQIRAAKAVEAAG